MNRNTLNPNHTEQILTQEQEMNLKDLKRIRQEKKTNKHRLENS